MASWFQDSIANATNMCYFAIALCRYLRRLIYCAFSAVSRFTWRPLKIKRSQVSLQVWPCTSHVPRDKGHPVRSLAIITKPHGSNTARTEWIMCGRRYQEQAWIPQTQCVIWDVACTFAIYRIYLLANLPFSESAI